MEGKAEQWEHEGRRGENGNKGKAAAQPRLSVTPRGDGETQHYAPCNGEAQSHKTRAGARLDEAEGEHAAIVRSCCPLCDCAAADAVLVAQPDRLARLGGGMKGGREGRGRQGPWTSAAHTWHLLLARPPASGPRRASRATTPPKSRPTRPCDNIVRCKGIGANRNGLSLTTLSDSEALPFHCPVLHALGQDLVLQARKSSPLDPLFPC